MSEEFDKEAEREKLREKFAEDEEKRSETQRMSELLLQGATMTNKHCDSCGDPLFRQNGQMFCPTCQRGAGDGAERASSEGDQRAAGAQPQQGQNPQRAEDGRARNQGEQPRAETPADTRDGAGRSPSQLPDTAEVVAEADANPSASPPAGHQGTPQPPTGGGDVDAPRAELRRAVTETARNASAATDPRTARAWLEASKEAAEALAALEG